MKRTIMLALALGASLPVAAQAQSFFGGHEEHREGREGGFGGEHREGREGGFGGERHEDHHGRR
ncbi:hypothetical protein Geu3261_0031_030 [Komagataeibacter europaeus NBRC 3261]|uniref:Uncharacterized protein n=1 Tax=Komagataeibacter europaeus NBRC 3261 TaxID=1234669 RepID=A0A0D6PXX9_KOMEU|nr:hypothetical protein [Komagataeibacter europaeus]GAN95625.1 hypothetical protein Geu3261_0031_030 [Komagataeibacter europaeus NBRC 3261]